MIFNFSNGPFNKTPVLDAAYPQDVSVNVGDSATFRVIVAQDGKPPEYTYQWYYDGAAVDGETADTYTREAEAGSHSVYCLVTNKAGSVVSRTATLHADTLYLYKTGDMCTEVTGGWTKIGEGSVSNTVTGLVITIPQNYKAGGAKTVKLIDVTDYNLLECKRTGNPELLLYVSKDGTDVAQGSGNINISKVTGLCSIRFYTSSSGSTGRKVTVTSMCLKK